MTDNEENINQPQRKVTSEEEIRRLEMLYGPKQPDQEVEEKAEAIEIAEIISEPRRYEAQNETQDGDNSAATETDILDANHDDSRIEYEIKTINRLCLLFINPFVLPSIIMLLILKLSILDIWIDSDVAGKFIMIVAGATFALPVLLLFLLKTGRVIGSFMLEGRTERMCPYIISTFALGGIAWFLYTTGFPDWVWLIFVGLTACGLINFAINFKFKISSQTSALGAEIAVFLVINNDGLSHPALLWWIVGTVLVAGITGSLSLLSRRHTPLEVLSGYATGFLPVILFSLAA